MIEKPVDGPIVTASHMSQSVNNFLEVDELEDEPHMGRMQRQSMPAESPNRFDNIEEPVLAMRDDSDHVFNDVR